MRNIRLSCYLPWTVDTCQDWDAVSTCIVSISADPKTDLLIYLNVNYLNLNFILFFIIFLDTRE